MFSSLSRRRIGILLVLTCVLLITLDRSDNAVIAKVRRAFAVGVHPFEVAAQVVARPIERMWYGITNYGDLARQNARLADEVGHQRGAAITAMADHLQTAEMMAMNRLPSAGNYRQVLARVVGGAPGNFQKTVEISAGRAQGIRVGMPVTDVTGLVGRIRAVRENSAVVLLVTDPQFNLTAEVTMARSGNPEGQLVPDAPLVTTAVDGTAVLSSTPLDGALPPEPQDTVPLPDFSIPAPPTSTTIPKPARTTVPRRGRPRPTPAPTTVPPSSLPGVTTTVPGPTTTTTTTTVVAAIRETGTISGQAGSGLLLLNFLDGTRSDAVILPGANVSTAGGARSLAPPGIPIGQVTKVQARSEGGSPIVEVEPSARLGTLTYVAVVLYVPQEGAGGE